MATAKNSGDLESKIEQKMLEFFGDPDSGLTLKKSFLLTVHKRMQKNQKLTSHADVLKKYGLR